MKLEKILIGTAFASTLFLTSARAQDFSPGLTVHPANPLYLSQSNESGLGINKEFSRSEVIYNVALASLLAVGLMYLGIRRKLL